MAGVQSPFRLFAKGLFKHWWALLSCAAFTVLAVFAAESNQSNTWTIWGTTVLAGVFFIVAAFRTWKDEHEKAEKAETGSDSTIACLKRDFELAAAQRDVANSEVQDLKRQFQEQRVELQRERNKSELRHPDVIIERVGNTATGTLSLYNRGGAEAFSVSITAMSCHNGMVFWKTPNRLPVGKTARLCFTVSDTNGISSIEHDAVVLLSQMLHVTHKETLSEEEIQKAFEPIRQWVSVDYFDALTKTKWQTPCQFVYDRKTGELTVHPGDAAPSVTQ
jgi:hypothetical protein